MTSQSGYVNYLRYTVGSNKGDATNGVTDSYSRYDVPAGQADTLNDPWSLGIQGQKRVEYTSAKVTNSNIAVTAGAAYTQNLKWAPVIPGSLLITNTDPTEGANPKNKFIFDSYTAKAAVASGKATCATEITEGKLYVTDKQPVISEVTNKNGCVIIEVTFNEVATLTEAGTIKYGTTGDDKFNSGNSTVVPYGEISIAAEAGLLAGTIDVSYLYKKYCSIEIKKTIY